MTRKVDPIAVRFSQSEKQQIQSAAVLSGKSVSEYIRGRLFAPELAERQVCAQEILDALQQVGKSVETLRNFLLVFVAKTLPGVDIEKASQLPDIKSILDLFGSEMPPEIKKLLSGD